MSILSNLNNIKYVFSILGAVAIGLLAFFFYAGLQGFGPGLVDYEYRIANHCILNRYSAYEINIDCEGIIERIDSEVFKVGWDDTYLIATTHPVTKRKYPNSPGNTYSEPDMSITYWWIRDLVNKKAYGPLSKSEFVQKKIELKIPDIELITVDEAKVKGTKIIGDEGRRNWISDRGSELAANCKTVAIGNSLDTVIQKMGNADSREDAGGQVTLLYLRGGFVTDAGISFVFENDSLVRANCL